ncbi:shikimate dehydrogenase family protein [Urechidicola croceus]|uniref:Shikimate dehydrogenase n=1 Tax=Urechidicola croceus TaxID=1850246 RepID=A0A1D8PBC1_9FLAO|nr:shikimate dehydrogenase [Urechidicola croceus]AOW21869.1 shikimate dehydrogenase [Urechidicola croceus]
MKHKTKFGLIGKNISYSFSKGYFLEKFKNLNLHSLTYRNFDIPEIEEFPFLIYHKEEEFRGFNVTIPYKESIMRYLSEIDSDAQKIGAVNTIKVTEDNQLIGYNTDIYGFENSLKPLLKSNHRKALILGTGGASKAIAFVLEKLNIEYVFVSRSLKSENIISYENLNKEIIANHQLIINCTPLGTYPNIEDCPNIPYKFLTDKHFLYDLIYNPPESTFLKQGKQHGAIIKNGLQMLELQAEKSWEIWNEK